MGKRRWTTTEQRDWLEARIPAFTEAQQTKSAASTFFPDVHKEWRESWPTPAPTEDEIKQWGSAEIAEAKLAKRAQERVVTWFHNNTRATSSSTGARGILKLAANSRLLHGWQAYQQLYYESFKAEIESEYKSYVEKCEATEQKPKTSFEFRNEACQKRFLEETEEVKQEVEEYRAKLRDGEETKLPEGSIGRNKEIQRAIEKLPRTLDRIGQCIADQTKWQVTIMVGGPTPRLNGKLTTLICHFGTTADGKNFEEFLGHEGYHEHLESTFDDFLHASFSDDDCNNRRLDVDSKESTPSEAFEGDAVDRGMKKEQSGNGKTKERTSSDVTPPISQYELERERNIARNREALKRVDDELLEMYGDVGLQKKKPVTKAKTKKDKPEGKRRVSARLNVAEQSVAQCSPTTSTADSHTDRQQDVHLHAEGPVDTSAHPDGSAAAVNACNMDQASNQTTTNTASIEAAASNEGNADVSSANADAASTHIDTASTNIDVASTANRTTVLSHRDTGVRLEGVFEMGGKDRGLDSDVEMGSDTSQGLDNKDKALDGVSHDAHTGSASQKQDTPSNQSPPPAEPFQPFTNGAVSSRVPTPPSGHALLPHNGLTSDAAPLSRGLTPPSGPSLPAPTGFESDTAASTTTKPTLSILEPPASLTNTVVKSSLVPALTAVPTSQSSDGLASSLYATKLSALTVEDMPPWLHAMLDYLRQVSAEERWQELVFRLVTFESCRPPAGKLPTKERPEEVAAWIRRHRKDLVPEFKVSEFGVQWTKWWMDIQPDWRKEELGDGNDFLSRQIPDDETWASLLKGGTAGLYTVVVALSWWIKQLPSGGTHSDVWRSVEDITWVLTEVTKTLSHSGGMKRSVDADTVLAEDEPQRKRRRTST